MVVCGWGVMMLVGGVGVFMWCVILKGSVCCEVCVVVCG